MNCMLHLNILFSVYLDFSICSCVLEQYSDSNTRWSARARILTISLPLEIVQKVKFL